MFKGRKKYQEEMMAMQKAASQANAMQQQQSVMAAAQAKQQEMQMEAQIEIQKMQAEAQITAQKMQLEFQLKAQLEEAAHKRRMNEIHLGNQAKVAGHQIQGDAKKDGIEKSAHFQSRMIEQRKGDGPPIANPDGMMGDIPNMQSDFSFSKQPSMMQSMPDPQMPPQGGAPRPRPQAPIKGV